MDIILMCSVFKVVKKTTLSVAAQCHDIVLCE